MCMYTQQEAERWWYRWKREVIGKRIYQQARDYPHYHPSNTCTHTSLNHSYFPICTENTEIDANSVRVLHVPYMNVCMCVLHCHRLQGVLDYMDASLLLCTSSECNNWGPARCHEDNKGLLTVGSRKIKSYWQSRNVSFSLALCLHPPLLSPIIECYLLCCVVLLSVY